VSRSLSGWSSRVRRALKHGEERLVRAGLAPGHRDYRPFVVVSQARTGSNLLVSLLDSHPHIDARGELLQRLQGATVASRLSEIYGPKPRRIQAAGFKCFYYHPLDDPEAPIWSQLRAVDQLHVVHLTRRNVLRTVTSRGLAGLTGEWLERRPSPAGGAVEAKPRVRFTPEELTLAFEQNEAWAAECAEGFRDHPMLDVVYEDLASGPAAIDKVVAFLGVGPHSLTTTLRRQNPEPLSELIDGFDELRQAFEGTRWAPYFAPD